MRLDTGFCVAFCRSPAWSPTAGSCWAAAIAERSRMATSACMNRLRHPELSIASLAFSRIIRLFIFPPVLSERDTPHNLKGISLDCGRVREFLEELEAHARLSSWQDDTCRATNGIDPIVGGPGWVDSRAAVVGSLPLTVAHQPELQERMHVLLQRKNLHQRIVEVEGLAGVDIGSLLGRMKLVELIG